MQVKRRLLTGGLHANGEAKEREDLRCRWRPCPRQRSLGPPSSRRCRRRSSRRPPYHVAVHTRARPARHRPQSTSSATAWRIASPWITSTGALTRRQAARRAHRELGADRAVSVRSGGVGCPGGFEAVEEITAAPRLNEPPEAQAPGQPLRDVRGALSHGEDFAAVLVGDVGSVARRRELAWRWRQRLGRDAHTLSAG